MILYDKKHNSLISIDIDEAFDDLYMGKYLIPTYDNVIKLINNSEKSIQKFFEKDINKKILINQKELCKNEIYLFFDSQTFMLFRQKIDVIKNRKKNLATILPNKELIDYLKQKLNEKVYNIDKIKHKFAKKTIKLLEQLDLDYILDKFEEVSESYTNVIRPYFTSYLYHTNPMFYTRNELYILKKNFGENFIDKELTYKILLKHLKYIYDKKEVQLVQKYTLLGGYKMNYYLRNSDYLDLYLESNIIKLWKLINNAPKFNKNHIIFRFINNDFLDTLKVNDTTFDLGFMSCTRNFFYRSSRYTFGDILLIIHIPKNIKGVALCIEGTSVFPDENEILFSPKTNFKIIKKEERDIYVSIDETKKVKVYELEFVNKEKIKINEKKNKVDIQTVNFEKMDKNITFDDKINYLKKIIKPTNTFQLEVKNDIYENVQLDEWKTNFVYSSFFYQLKPTKPNEFSGIHYFIHNDSFWIEIFVSEKDIIFLISFIDNIIYKKNKISDDKLLNIIRNIAKYFEPRITILNSNYENCERKIQIGGFDIDVDVSYINTIQVYQNTTYNSELYNYLKYKKKRFKKSDVVIPLFKYKNLDKLRKINVENMLDKFYNSKMYMIYKNFYSNCKSVSDFIIQLCDNMCYMLFEFFEVLIDKTDGSVFEKTNLNLLYYNIK